MLKAVYGIDLLKKFSDEKGNYENVKFKIHNDTDKYYVVAQLNDDGMAMKRYRVNDTSLRSWRRTRQG